MSPDLAAELQHSRAVIDTGSQELELFRGSRAYVIHALLMSRKAIEESKTLFANVDDILARR